MEAEVRVGERCEGATQLAWDMERGPCTTECKWPPGKARERFSPAASAGGVAQRAHCGLLAFRAVK